MNTSRAKQRDIGKKLRFVRRTINNFTNGAIGPQQVVSQLHIFREAARCGEPSAEALLGHLSDQGVGVRKSLSKAVFWYRAAAKHHYAHAQAWLGYAYENGTGVKCNLKKAFFWYGRSGPAK